MLQIHTLVQQFQFNVGVGPGTGTNIPQYGLYVDATASSNDATLMTEYMLEQNRTQKILLLVFMDYIIKIGILIVKRSVDCSKRQQEQIDMLLNHLTLVGNVCKYNLNWTANALAVWW